MSLSADAARELSFVAMRVAQEAAEILVAHHRSRPEADEKGRADLVTEIDRKSEALVKRKLAELTPEIPVVGEETGGATNGAGLVWFVDPLDGTTNYVHGHPFFCVAVGLMHEGTPTAGAVVAPMLHLRYRGVWIPGAFAEATRNDVPCRVSPIASLRSALLATGFPGQRDRGPDHNFGSFVAVKRAAQAVRRCGAAAIDLCFVADGTYEGFWERKLRTWDVCAASALVLAAGGRVTAIDGAPLDFASPRIAATNGLIHEALLAAIRSGEEIAI